MVYQGRELQIQQSFAKWKKQKQKQNTFLIWAAMFSRVISFWETGSQIMDHFEHDNG